MPAWQGPYDTRADLDEVVEEYVAESRDDFASMVRREPDARVRALAWSRWPELEAQYRERLHTKADELWARHARDTGQLS